VRPTLAVLSDKKSYQKKEDDLSPFGYDMFDNLTALYASNNTLTDDQNILGTDDLINMGIV